MNLEIRKLGKTAVAVTMPWSVFVRKGTRLLCSDGKIRAPQYLAQTADTFFSVPAAVRVNGKYVTGYMTQKTYFDKNTGLDVNAYCFVQHVGNAHLLPDWPNSFSPEHEKLIAGAQQIVEKNA